MSEGERPLICAFLKVRNEILREGNLFRVLDNIDQYADAAVVCDDASTDGTREYLQAWVEKRREKYPDRYALVITEPDEQDFKKELSVKQHMLNEVHKIQPWWVLWMDGDEVFDASGTKHLRAFATAMVNSRHKAFSFHYTQFWRSTLFARTDGGFDDGWFIKLWKYDPALSFAKAEGTHHAQFPVQIMEAFQRGQVAHGPFEQLHYGNYGTNLRWKVIQYRGGLGGWERHLVFGNGTFRVVDQEIIPEHCEKTPMKLEALGAYVASPAAFNNDEEKRIRSLYNLKGMPQWFTVVVPAYNRAADLPRALDSLIAQTWQQWIAIVLDDGSLDNTRAIMRTYQDADPRIFYARYPANRGGVAMNEIGMRLACEMTEWWTRLGSDDHFGPKKLEHDAFAFQLGHEAVFGPFQVRRGDNMEEICNPPAPPDVVRNALLTAGFAASWANVAVKTDVLKRVRAKYGNFCDPRLRNMEDFLVNARIARETKGFVWRGTLGDTLYVNPSNGETARIMQAFKDRTLTFDAAWNCVMTGASGNQLQTTRDENMTRTIIAQENIEHGR